MMPDEPDTVKNSEHSGQVEPVLLLRLVLDDVLADRRFFLQRNISIIEFAEHVLTLASEGERDLDRLRNSSLAKLGLDRLEATDP